MAQIQIKKLDGEGLRNLNAMLTEVYRKIIVLAKGIPGAGDMLKSIYDVGDNGIVDNSEKLDGSTKEQVQTHVPSTHKISHQDGENDEINVGGLSGELVDKQKSDFLKLSDTPASYAGQIGKIAKVKATEDGLEFASLPGGGDMLKSVYDIDENGIVDNSEKVDGIDIPNTIANVLTNHNATAHPVSVLKFATGSYSYNFVYGVTTSPTFEISAYSHSVRVKTSNSSYPIILEFRAVGATTYHQYYGLKKASTKACTGYARWYYHSASKQAIWGIWDEDQKRLTCVLVEEDEGYCKLYPELKENQKLIKIKNPEKYEKLFAWDIMELSKENKIKEKEFEEIKGAKK